MLLTDAVVHHNYPSALLPPPFAVVDLALGFSTFLCRLERPARVITDGGSKSDSNRAAQHRPTQTQLSHGPARLTVKNLGRRHRNTSTSSVSDPCSLAFTSSPTSPSRRLAATRGAAATSASSTPSPRSSSSAPPSSGSPSPPVSRAPSSGFAASTSSPSTTPPRAPSQLPRPRRRLGRPSSGTPTSGFEFSNGTAVSVIHGGAALGGGKIEGGRGRREKRAARRG